MKKLVWLLACVSLFIGGLFLVSCDKATACGRAEDRCRECYTGTELDSCLSSVDTCKILLPGLGRESCCNDITDGLDNCN